jgi:DMSO/TMAO reductase YedYZ molybdopterin-dependent catalytic subunit
MTIASDPVAPGRRTAEPGAGISIEELGLAGRNHAMPMEMLREDVTPVGLHYLLTHYDMPRIEAATWSLSVNGAVEHPVVLGLADLERLPRHTVRVTLECAGNGRATLEPRPISQPWLNGAVGTADWSGVRLADILATAAPAAEAVDLVFTGHDRGVERGVEQEYARGLPLSEAVSPDVIVAFEMNGAPLPVQHGFPARLVVPGWYGMAHVKWLRCVTVLDHAYDGYQNRAYRLRQSPDEPGTPVTRIEPRALLMPPGVPEFLTRKRVLPAGAVRLRGRAWSGWAPIVRVEVSVDDGDTWADAELVGDQHAWAWREFGIDWDAAPGDHVLRVRAHDGSGRIQPDEPPWNAGGFSNTADQPLHVHVPPE